MNQTFGASGATIRSLKPPRISPTHWYLACKNHVFEALFLFLPIIIFHLPNRSVNYTSGSPKAPSESWHHLKYPPHSWLLPSMILDILKSCCQNQYLWKLEQQSFYEKAISNPPLLQVYLSNSFQETISHTFGAPGSPIRALKLPKLSLMQPHFPQLASIWLFLSS